MLKTGNEFLDSFARLGVFSKVQALMDDESESESSVIRSPTDSDLVVAQPTSQPSTSSGATEESSIKGSQLLLLIINVNKVQPEPGSRNTSDTEFPCFFSAFVTKC